MGAYIEAIKDINELQNNIIKLQSLEIDYINTKAHIENIIAITSIISAWLNDKENYRVKETSIKQLFLYNDLIKQLVGIQRDLNSFLSLSINTDNTRTSIIKFIEISNIIFDWLCGKDSYFSLINKKTKNNVDLYKQIVTELSEISRLSWTSIDGRVVKNNKAITENYIQFVDKIDKIQVDKLKTAANMFEKMADFSKSINGNFEKLAESINEDLMPVLEELKETLNKIPEKIDTNAASVSASVAAYSSPMAGPTTPWEMTAQVNRENPSMSPEKVKEVVDTRLNEQARAQAQSLESKFDELIELLKSGMARVSLT
jgi:hypothetical protein